MRFTGFFLLLLLAALTGSGVYFMVLAKEDAPAKTIDESALLFPEFAAAANRVTEIQLLTAEETLNIQQTEGAWTLEERGGYDVQLSVVKKLALSVAQLRIEESKTAKPENHARLGLQAPDAEGSNSKQLTFKDASGTVLASLIVGDSKYRAGAQGVFVRRTGEEQTWLCAGRVELPYSTKSWMDTAVLKLAKERIASLRILHHNGPEMSIQRSPDSEGQFDLQEIPLGRELTSAGNATAAATALSSLSFEDVRPVGEVQFDSDPVAQSTYFCEDGLVLVFSASRQDDKTWFKITASLGMPTKEPAEDASDEELEAAKAQKLALETEIADLNQRLGPWAFELPSYKADQIAKPLEDLLKSLEGPGSGSTPDFSIGEDGQLPANIQQLLDNQGGGVPPMFQPPAAAGGEGEELLPEQAAPMEDIMDDSAKIDDSIKALEDQEEVIPSSTDDSGDDDETKR